MKNRHDLFQLQRDAEKQGAWQAKLAYASFLLETDPEKLEKAKNYLEEIVDNDIRAYVIEAKSLLELHFPTDGKIDAVALASLAKTKDMQNIDFQKPYTRKICESSEFQYKKIRYEYDNPHLPEEKRKQIITNAIKKLNALLNYPLEVTDTLRAKIYFQLIHLHIKQAKIKGQRIYLEEAKKYCLLLINDSTLASMVKAELAAKIYDQIEEITDSPIYNFTTYVKESFKTGREGNKMLLKYAGLVIGNVVDFALIGFPKILTNHPADGYVRQGRTVTEEVLKYAGFGAVFKNVAKKLGAHVVGNLLGGPMGAFCGALYYPFAYWNQKYQTTNYITKIAENVIKIEKEEVNNTLSTNNRVNQTLKSIFERSDKNQSIKKIDYSKTELNTPIKVLSKRSLLPIGMPTKALCAYGSVFANVVKPEPKEVINKSVIKLSPG